MKRIRMTEYGLQPNSDFDSYEVRESFFHYYSALRRQAIEQSARTQELIPVSAILARVSNEFGKSERFLHNLWVDMGNLLFSESEDDADDDIDVVVIDLDEESDDETLSDFREFIEHKIRERAAEEQLFAFLESPNGVLEHDVDY